MEKLADLADGKVNEFEPVGKQRTLQEVDDLLYDLTKDGPEAAQAAPAAPAAAQPQHATSGMVEPQVMHAIQTDTVAQPQHATVVSEDPRRQITYGDVTPEVMHVAEESIVELSGCCLNTVCSFGWEITTISSISYTRAVSPGTPPSMSSAITGIANTVAKSIISVFFIIN